MGVLSISDLFLYLFRSTIYSIYFVVGVLSISLPIYFANLKLLRQTILNIGLTSDTIYEHFMIKITLFLRGTTLSPSYTLRLMIIC